jgi:cytoskeletal protein RodZ
MSANNKTPGKASSKAKKSKPKNKKKLLWQIIILMIVLIALAASAFTAFFTSTITFGTKPLDGKKVSGLSSMTDAKLVCDKEVKEKYGNSLQVATLNHSSSRYEDHYGGYKLFYDVRVYRNQAKTSGTDHLMFKCYVYNDGDVSETGIIKTAPTPAKALRKSDSNFFGF